MLRESQQGSLYHYDQDESRNVAIKGEKVVFENIYDSPNDLPVDAGDGAFAVAASKPYAKINGTWLELSTQAGLTQLPPGGSSNDLLTTDGNGNYSWRTTLIQDNQNVTLTTPSANDTLVYDGLSWTNTQLTLGGHLGDVSISPPQINLICNTTQQPANGKSAPV